MVSGVASLSIGTVLGFSAILIPQLVAEGHLTSPKSAQASWIASLSNLGQLAGSLATGAVSNAFGRKVAIIGLCAPLFAGWLAIGLSQGDFGWICVGRVLQGIGIMSSVTQVKAKYSMVQVVWVNSREKFDSVFHTSSLNLLHAHFLDTK